MLETSPHNQCEARIEAHFDAAAENQCDGMRFCSQARDALSNREARVASKRARIEASSVESFVTVAMRANVLVQLGRCSARPQFKYLIAILVGLTCTSPAKMSIKTI
ncbi:MAG: hypothetical protein SH820_15325 [Xanthomonadales bacterium]|nr:hypothetical protein [Xanthomonadales bacterium]